MGNGCTLPIDHIGIAAFPYGNALQNIAQFPDIAYAVQDTHCPAVVGNRRSIDHNRFAGHLVNDNIRYGRLSLFCSNKIVPVCNVQDRAVTSHCLPFLIDDCQCLKSHSALFCFHILKIRILKLCAGACIIDKGLISGDRLQKGGLCFDPAGDQFHRLTGCHFERLGHFMRNGIPGIDIGENPNESCDAC